MLFLKKDSQAKAWVILTAMVGCAYLQVHSHCINPLSEALPALDHLLTAPCRLSGSRVYTNVLKAVATTLGTGYFIPLFDCKAATSCPSIQYVILPFHA